MALELEADTSHEELAWCPWTSACSEKGGTRSYYPSDWSLPQLQNAEDSKAQSWPKLCWLFSPDGHHMLFHLAQIWNTYVVQGRENTPGPAVKQLTGVTNALEAGSGSGVHVLALVSQRRSLGKPRGRVKPETLPGQGVTLEVAGGRC